MNKMLNKIICIVIAGLAFSLLLISCDTSLPDIENDGRGIIIQLKVPKALEVTTKGGKLDDIPISDVWVLQYAKENSGLLRARKYSGSAISSTPQNGTLEVNTDGFSDVDSRFYVIANAVDGFFTKDDTTITGNAMIKEVDLKKKTSTWTGTNEPNFVTAGPIALTTDSIQKYGGKAVIVAPLERAFARINLTWTKPDNSNITITKVDLCNKPKAMAAYARGGGSLSDKYPIWTTPEDKKNVMEDVVSIVAGDLPANSTQQFYMPENLRGMGTGRTLAEKNMPEKGPEGSLDGCTFILMSGEYKYQLAGGGDSSPIQVQYKIYLGGNLTNDYNIQRGYSYDLKVNISGANSADVRVTITDGRVVVFDDVVVMDTVNVDF